MFPEAPVYTALYDSRRLPPEFAGLPVRTSWLQRIPAAAARHRWLVPVMPFAFGSFDLRGYDLVLSSSHACAHGVRVPPGTVHVCYCHTPMRYAWDRQATYLAALPAPARPAASAALAWLRTWDRRAAQRVDHYIANSHNVAERITRQYGRESTVIYPPVDVEFFTPSPLPSPPLGGEGKTGAAYSPSHPEGGEGRVRGDYYLVASRLVPYKRIDLAIEACNQLRLPLVVVGDGPERGRLQAMAGPTVRFAGEVDDQSLREFYRGCSALIFPGEEDFGMVPVEAQACGRPVIAYGRGGALETVLPGRTGMLFTEPSAASLAEALAQFDPRAFDPHAIHAHAEQFSQARFRRELHRVIERVTAGSAV